ncbi:MAG: hypothetical protein COV72_00535 [Candidatus Omnitrophica bacterium CG11_big_fil_rev_8_21_14_0_20_42_13]|uniref:TonB C-terminal domain-containing protein n=1 Tax=Candidatus Ghiorseimicrobium undicola TaxID=1974746 RepID=A0A2H0LZY2_9BACT|nr:MAG: hypothetical protein COV72_00535 [Candidatus Omnitrophica bacterium CG11_big_fil_rev_8_21_14_0_20_42_13]
MFSDKIFLVSLSVSITAHFGFLAGMHITDDPNRPAPLQKIEVTYQKIELPKKIIKIEQKITRETAAQRKEFDFFPKSENNLPPPPEFNDYSEENRFKGSLVKKPLILDIEPAISGIKSVSIPDLKADLSVDKADLPKNPVYLKYYQQVRERIRRYAYYNYSRTDSGDVYVSFVVSKNGNLQALRIIDETSIPNDYLKEIAAKSVKDASPYPPIPDELNYPELSFVVIIAFKLE